MARREQVEAEKRRKQELSEKLAVSREAIGLSKALVKDSMNVKRMVVRKIQRNQMKVALGSAVFGLVASTLLRRRKGKEDKKRGFGGWLKGLVVGMAVKKAKGMAIEKAKKVLIEKIQNRREQHETS